MTSNKSFDPVALDRTCIWHPFTQAATAPEPIAIVSGRGLTLTAADGSTYLDLISSWWVNMHGHCHPRIARAVAEQARTLEHVIFAGFTHPPAVRLAKALVDLLPGGLSRVFYTDNGSTAVESGLKMAYQYFRNAGHPGRRRIAAFTGGYHGDTFGAMSAGRTSGFYRPFEPLLFEVDFLPYPATWIDDPDVGAKEQASLDALERLIETYPDGHCAILIEPLVQGASGMNMCRPEFLRRLSERARAAGILMIYDEVMTGFGRTGDMFACRLAGTAPDIVCLSKGITGGFMPLAATVCTETIYQGFLDAGFAKALAHGHSYTANPLGCAAGLASLEVFREERTLERVQAIEAVHLERIAGLAGHPRVSRRRVRGCIAALDISARDAGYESGLGPRLRDFFMSKGLLLRPLGNVVYLMPPYCVTDAELHRAWDAIGEALDNI